MIQNRYYNSPSSLIASIQQTKAPNTRIHSAYRRSNTSSHSSGKHNTTSNKPLKEISRLHHMKAESMIKNVKASVNIKNSKSENKSVRKNVQNLKVRDHKLQPYSISSNSHYLASHLHSLPKNQQHLFPYQLNNTSMKQNSDDEHYIEGENESIN